MAHISTLCGQRLGLRQIAKQAGVTRNTVRRFLRGTPRVYNTSTTLKIANAQPVIAPRTLVPGLPAWRIVKWLESEGFSRERIAELVGIHRLVLRKRYTMRVVARLRRIKRHYEAQDPGRGSFGEADEPTG